MHAENGSVMKHYISQVHREFPEGESESTSPANHRRDAYQCRILVIRELPVAPYNGRREGRYRAITLGKGCKE